MAKKNSDMKEKFAKLKISSQSFQAGGIYVTKDINVLFPGREEIVDKPRLMVVFGNKKDLNDPMMATVLAAPITTVLDGETTQCLPVEAGVGNLHSKSLIKAGMVQPILKTDLGKYIGCLDKETRPFCI